MIERALLWMRDDGAEWCQLRLSPDRLTATGVQLGSEPVPYRLDYAVETGPGFATHKVRLRAAGAGWSRLLTLRHSEEGGWSVEASAHGDLGVALPPPGGEMSALARATDADLELCPLTNTLPIRRLGMLGRVGADHEIIAAWVAVPALAITPSRQRYAAIDAATIRVAAGTFTADLTVDADGVVIDYPGLAHLAAG
jgi:hypothetical protein